MRTRVIVMLALLTIALIVCAVMAARSHRRMSRTVSVFLIALIPPILGNLIIIFSTSYPLSLVGSYIYFIGLDWVVVVLLRFSSEYCDIEYVGSKLRTVILVLVFVDVLQLLANNFTGHAFYLEETIVEGAPYYALVPLLGQTFHRIVAYGVFFVSIGIFIYKVFTSARIYMERYAVILASFVFTGAWETYYIFSGAPIDRSMIGFGLCGLLVYFFALHYRPFRLLDRMLSRVVTNMNDAVLFYDTRGACIFANSRARAMLEMRQNGPMPENSNRKIEKVIGGWRHAFNSDWTDYRKLTRDGSLVYYDIKVQQIRDERDRHVGASMIIRDATEEERKLQREKELATHDRLTGLYNKEHLYDRIRETIDANPDVRYIAVATDVKDFKIVNDIFSNEFGDFVLKSIADRMRRHATEHEVYGRLSGDKFGYIMPKDEFDLELTESRLRDHTFRYGNVSHPVVMHMGVFEIEERDMAPDIMFDRAFMAIASIKNDFQNHVAFYDRGMRDSTIWSQKISSEIDHAISDGQIRPYLQPLVDREGHIIGAEVLVRWIHPEEGFLSPASFIPVFERNGMISRLDAFMWESACRILKNWEERGIDMFLSVNISPKDFYFIDVYATIRGLVEKYGIDPAKLRLEITETVMMSDMENRLRILEDLRNLGFLVEMDDFGSGYSSLNMLKDMPVDVLKIDMVFLYKTKDLVKAQTILKTIINLSDNLGIPSVTEGVETADQRDMLLDMGCRMFQGYFFAKPMPLEDFEKIYNAA